MVPLLKVKCEWKKEVPPGTGQLSTILERMRKKTFDRNWTFQRKFRTKRSEKNNLIFRMNSLIWKPIFKLDSTNESEWVMWFMFKGTNNLKTIKRNIKLREAKWRRVKSNERTMMHEVLIAGQFYSIRNTYTTTSSVR